MSLPPQSKVMDYQKYMNQYMANLNKDIQNQAFVYNAVSANISGDMTNIPQQPQDTRSVEEKMRDIENLKIKLQSLLMTLTDGKNAIEIIKSLSPEMIQQGVQSFPILYQTLKPIWSQGVPSVIFIQALENIAMKQEHTAGIDMNLQQSNSNNLALSPQLLQQIINGNDLDALRNRISSAPIDPNLQTGLLQQISYVKGLIANKGDLAQRITEAREQEAMSGEDLNIPDNTLIELPTKQMLLFALDELDTDIQNGDRSRANRTAKKMLEYLSIPDEAITDLQEFNYTSKPSERVARIEEITPSSNKPQTKKQPKKSAFSPSLSLMLPPEEEKQSEGRLGLSPQELKRISELPPVPTKPSTAKSAQSPRVATSASSPARSEAETVVEKYNPNLSVMSMTTQHTLPYNLTFNELLDQLRDASSGTETRRRELLNMISMGVGKPFKTKGGDIPRILPIDEIVSGKIPSSHGVFPSKPLDRKVKGYWTDNFNLKEMFDEYLKKSSPSPPPTSKPSLKGKKLKESKESAPITGKLESGQKFRILPQTTPLEEYSEASQPEMSAHGIYRRKMSGKGVSFNIKEEEVNPAPKHIKLKISGVIEKEPAYMPFGRYAINKYKLSNDILMLRTPKNGAIPKLPTMKISNKVSKILAIIMDKGVPSFEMINDLITSDKEILHKILNEAHIQNISTPNPSREKDEEAYRRFTILKGEIIAGNTNQNLAKELKRLIIMLMSKDLLPKREATNALVELALLEV